MKALLIFVFIQTFALYGSADNEISKFISVCSAKDSNLNECVKKSGHELIMKIASGLPDLKISPIDPMLTPSVSFTENSKDTHLTINYKDVIQRGISQGIIADAKIELDKKNMYFRIKYPIYSFEADYEAKGEIYDFKIHGNGRANITVWDSEMEINFNFHIENDHIKVDTVKVDQKFDKIYLDYKDLIVNDDPELSASAGTFINENSAEILNGFKPQLQEFYSSIIKEHLQNLFDQVPYNKLFNDL